ETKALGDKDLAACRLADRASEKGAEARSQLAPLTDEKQAAKDPLPAVVKAVPALIRSLDHKEIRVRLAALHALETLGKDAAPAAEALAKRLTDDNRSIRRGAARALRSMAPAGAAKSVAALAKALTDDSANVRLMAAEALRRCGRQAKGAAKALAALRKGDDRMRPLAARALGALEADGKSVRADLVKA